MKSDQSEIINDLKTLIASGRSIVGTTREIRSEGSGVKWSISNLPDHISNYTTPINLIDHAIEIIKKVVEHSVDKDEFSSSFTFVNRAKQMYLHLL